MSAGIEQLLKSTLVLVAHPDDESLGCGILLQRIADAGIVLCTDGAPAEPRNWYSRLLNGREKYASKRRSEFQAAARIAGVRRVWSIPGIQDQSLCQSLDIASVLIARYVMEHRPQAILTHAFEAGHPDHDSCACLARWAGRMFSLPVWEMPFYHRPDPLSSLVYQRFIQSEGDEIVLSPSSDELHRKRLMLSRHRSQTAVISKFDTSREVFRPQLSYDFGRNPNPALSNFAVCEHVSIDDALARFRMFGMQLSSL